MKRSTVIRVVLTTVLGGAIVVAAVTSGGATALLSSPFAFADPSIPSGAPVVSGVSPAFGPTAGGTDIVISGSNLTAATAVTFQAGAGGPSGPASSYTVVSDSQIDAVTPASPNPAGQAITTDVVVTGPLGSSIVNGADHFHFVPGATQQSGTVGSGGGTLTNSNTKLTILGGALPGNTKVTITDFGTNNFGNLPGLPPGYSGVGNPVDIDFGPGITLLGGHGATLTLPYNPSLIQNGGNAAIYQDGAWTALATTLTPTSATTGTATATITAPGGYAVLASPPPPVTTTGSSSSSSSSCPAAGVLGLSPATGAAAGGAVVTITGYNFTGATAVNFGTAAATNINVVSGTQIVATSPQGTAGTVDVTVTTPCGVSPTTSNDQFTYVVTLPTAESVGASGGTLATTDGTFTMNVPAGALTGTATFAVSESTAAPKGIPSNFVPASNVYDLTGTGLSQPYAAVITYNASALGALSPNRLAVYVQATSGGAWSAVPTAAGTTAGTVTAYVSGPESLVVLASTQKLTDVTSSYWAAGDIDALLAEGIVSGFPAGTFQPEATVTRAQFVKMLDVTLGISPSSGVTGFTDVPSSAWFAPYVGAAVNAGIVTGESATQFAPNAPVTREDMALLLTRALKLTGTATLKFTDDAAIQPAALQGVEATVAAGYMNGFPNGSFDPNGASTRAQASAVLSRVVAHEAP